MGKPFKKELLSIPEIYDWANNLDISDLKNKIKEVKNTPLLVVGSGGSLSACYYASRLHQKFGSIAKPITPLELYYSSHIINKCSVLFLSSSGRNTDILTSFKTANSENPKNVMGLTFSNNTLLKQLAKKLEINSIYEYKSPIGKDGFLATNSLIAFFIILHRAYGNKLNNRPVNLKKSFFNELNNFIEKIDKDFTFKVLYGDWGLPIAIDIESKFSEAALGDVLLSDYRNFGHGRHNWIDKRPNTAIIALISPNDKELAEKTLSLLPESVPVLIISTDLENSAGSIELLIKSFYLTDIMGEIQNIDPGRPGVPDFGSKLYHLNYFKLLKKSNKRDDDIIAINRKLGNQSFYNLDTIEQNEWINSCLNFKKEMSNQKFDTIVFDYDGTLSKDRFLGLNSETGELLNNILDNNITIGIATGRGSSVRKDLRRVINQNYWDKVIIGYYNGSEIGYLNDELIPEKDFYSDERLVFLSNKLQEKFLNEISLKLKKTQLNIEFNNNFKQEKYSEILQYIHMLNVVGILCLQSDHSIDIILRPDVSKLNVLKFIEKTKVNKDNQILCIGDKGNFPGNDFELLSHKYSLSVDEVSFNKDSCWNFSKIVDKGVISTHLYLNKIKFFNDYFKISI